MNLRAQNLERDDMRLSLAITGLLSFVLLIGACSEEISEANEQSTSTLRNEAQSRQSGLGETPEPASIIAIPPNIPKALEAIDIVEAHESVMRNIYNTVTPSVVHILAINTATGNSDWMTPTQGEGSGFVWDPKGHIVTNYHVVDGAQEVVVTLWDGSQESATVLGADPFSDLAVLKVNPSNISLSPVKLGDDSSVEVGDFAIAIGHPFRQKHTMTSGIISAIGRTRPSGTTQFSIPDVIQTDAPINPGNSGGPLLNRLGEVVGINTQIISSGTGVNSGIGFAVPINIAKRVIPTLIEEQEYEYGWLGITGINLVPRHAEQLNLPSSTQGVYVHQTVTDSPADKAGLVPSGDPETYASKAFPEGGSIIVSINNEAVLGMDDLISYLVSVTRPGDTVTLGVLDEKSNETPLEVVLGVRPEVLP